MENQILQQILNEIKDIKADISDLKQGQSKLEAGQSKLEAGQAKLEAGQLKLEKGQAEIKKEINAIKEQTAFLTEFKTEIELKLNIVQNEIKEVKQNVYQLEQLTARNISDIAKIKSIIA